MSSKKRISCKLQELQYKDKKLEKLRVSTIHHLTSLKNTIKNVAERLTIAIQKIIQKNP